MLPSAEDFSAVDYPTGKGLTSYHDTWCLPSSYCHLKWKAACCDIHMWECVHEIV